VHSYQGRPIATSFVCPPVPFRNCDWSAIFKDEYEDGSIIGTGETEEEAVADLIEQAKENE
jgi:hypothetical protein